MSDLRKYGATIYSLGSTIPADLQKVALVGFTGDTLPPSIQPAQFDFFTSPDQIPPDMLKVAALPYAYGAAIPAHLKQVADLGYVGKVLSVAPDNLISYWPLWDASGTSVVNLASLRGMPAAVGYGVVNLIPNPSFEGTYSGGVAPTYVPWNPTGTSNGSFAESTEALYGAKSQRITKSDGGAGRWGVRAIDIYAPGPFSGTTVYQAVSFKVLSYSPGARVIFAIDYSGGPWGRGGSVTIGPQHVGVWTQIASTAVPDAGDTANVHVAIEGANADILADGLLLSETGYDYYDGDQPNCRWTGTAHASTSERIGPIPNAVSSNVTLAQPGIGDGKPAMLFNGTSSYVNIYSTQLADAFNGAEGTLLAWVKVANAGVWTDGNGRFIAQVYADGNNRVRIYKASINNRLVYHYTAGGTSETLNKLDASATGWFSVAITWSKAADIVRAYYDGAEHVSSGGLGVWAGAPVDNNSLIGAYNNVVDLWSGSIAHVALWNTPLSAAQIAYLSRVR